MPAIRKIPARRLRPHRLISQEGSSLVELALVLPVFLAMMLGVLEFGRLFYASIEVSNAARAGVDYGAQNLVTAADINGMQAAATNDGSDILNWKTTGLTATASQVCKCSNGTPTSCANAASTCTSPTHALMYVQVITQATIDPLFYCPGLPKSYTLAGQAIMRVQ